MNLDQILSAARWLVTGLGGYAVGRGWITADQVTMIGGAAAALVPLVWSFFTHTDAAKLKAVTAMPDVAQVRPMSNAAPDSAVALAAVDPTQPKVTR